MAVVNNQARWLGSLAGIAAAAVSIGLAELIAAFAGPQSAPVIAVGDVVVDSVPLPVKTFATSTFGTHDKTALIAGTFILLAIVAAVIGAWAVHDIRIGYAGIAAFGILGAVAAVTRPAAGFGAIFPSLIGACAGAGDALLRSARATGTATGPRHPSRPAYGAHRFRPRRSSAR